MDMKLIDSIAFLFLLTFIVTAYTEEFLSGPKDERYFYFVGDGDTEVSVIDRYEAIDEGLLKNYTDSPDKLNYWLFTRRNPTTPHILLYKDLQSLKKSYFQKDKMVVFVSHGWRGSTISRINTILTHAFLHNEDLNVIVFGWSAIAGANYATAKNGVPMLGKCLGKFIEWLTSQGASLQKMHLVGHSLGAHLVGNAGRYLKGAVRRITALDPAAPLWHVQYAADRINSTDAQYVEVIHTNTLLLGVYLGLGHTDFYPNGGAVQPGCGSSICSHSRSYDYLAASVMCNSFIAHKCSNMLTMQLNRCKGETELMGNNELRTKMPGIFRVNTEKTWPYEVRGTL